MVGTAQLLGDAEVHPLNSRYGLGGGGGGVARGTINEIWRAVGEHVLGAVADGKGVELPRLGCVTLLKPAQGPSRERVPVFLLDKLFAKEHSLTSRQALPLQHIVRAHPYAWTGSGQQSGCQPSHAINFADVASRCGHDKYTVQTVFGIIVSCLHQRVGNGEPVGLQLWPLCEFQCSKSKCQMLFDESCCDEHGLRPPPQKPMNLRFQGGAAQQRQPNPRSRNVRSPHSRRAEPGAPPSHGPRKNMKKPDPVRVAWEPEDEEVQSINKQQRPPRETSRSRTDPYAASVQPQAQSSPILTNIGNLSEVAADRQARKPKAGGHGPSPITDQPTEQLNMSVTMGQDQKLAVVRMCRLLDVFCTLDTRDTGLIKSHDISVGLARHFGIDLSGSDSDNITSFLNGNSGETISRVDFVRGFQHYELLGAPHYSMKLDHCDFEAGEFMVSEGEILRELYILQCGEVVVEKEGQILHRYCKKGDTFGELGKIYRDQSDASIRAARKSTALRVRLCLDNSFSRSASKGSEHHLRASQYNLTRVQNGVSMMSPGAWDDRSKTRQGRITARKDLDRDQFIQLVPLFESMPAELLSALATHLKMKTYAKGREIVQEGEFGDSMFIIADGIVDLRSASSTVKLAGKDSFGELGLIFRERRAFSAVSAVPTTVFELSSRDFDSCLTDYADYRVFISLLAEERRVQDLRKRRVPRVFCDVAPFLCDDLTSLGDRPSRPVPAWQLRTLLQDVLMTWSSKDVDWLLAGGPTQLELTHQLHFNDPKQVLDHNQILLGTKLSGSTVTAQNEQDRWREWKRQWSNEDNRYYYATSTPRGSSRCSQWDPPEESPWDSEVTGPSSTAPRAAGIGSVTISRGESTATPWAMHPMPNLPKWLVDIQTKIKLGSKNVSVLFRNFDVDNSGSVDVDELSQGLKKIGISLTDDDFRSLLSYVDPDGMGEIEIQTLVHRLAESDAVVEANPSGTGTQVRPANSPSHGSTSDWISDTFIKMRSWMQRAGLSSAVTFKRHSSGRSATMTADNFADAVRKANSSLSSWQTDRLMKIVDLDGDGKISLHEWLYRFDDSSKPPEWADTAWSKVMTTMSQKNILPRELLQNLDNSKDKISIVSLARGVSSIDPSFNHNDALACARRFDTDSSGLVNMQMLAKCLSGHSTAMSTEDDVLKDVRKKLLKDNTPDTIGTAFSRFDFDGNGTLSEDEFKRGLLSMGVRLTPMQIRRLIDHIDADGDGEISFDEFVTQFLKKQVVPVAEVKKFRKHLQLAVFDQDMSWRQLFEHWDDNSSNFLSLDEFERGLRALPRFEAKFPMTQRFIAGLFTLADKDDDGLLTFADFTDFLADESGRESIVPHEGPAVHSLGVAGISDEAPSSSVRTFTQRIFRQRVSPMEAFRCFDVDGDGFVSRGEFLSAFSGHSSAVIQTLGDLRTLGLSGRQVEDIYDTMEGSHRDFISFDAFQGLTNQETLSPHVEASIIKDVQTHMQKHAYNAMQIFRVSMALLLSLLWYLLPYSAILCLCLCLCDSIRGFTFCNEV